MPITKTTPSGSRATRLTVDSVPEGSISTHWEIVTPFDGVFTVVTTVNGSSSGNVLGGNLSYIDLWLPPFHSYTVRVRHGLKSGDVTDWTTRRSFESRGPLNSFENYQVLSGLGGVDNVIRE